MIESFWQIRANQEADLAFTVFCMYLEVARLIPALLKFVYTTKLLYSEMCLVECRLKAIK